MWGVLTPASVVVAINALDPQQPSTGFVWALVAASCAIIGLFIAGYGERRNALAPVCLAAVYLFGLYPFHGFITFGDGEILARVGTDAEYWRSIAALWVAVGTPFFWLGFRSRLMASLLARLPKANWHIDDTAAGTVTRALIIAGFGWVARVASYLLGFHFHQVGPTAIASDALPFQYVVTLLADIPTVIVTYLAMIGAVHKRRSLLLTIALPLLGLELGWGLISGSRFKMLLPLAAVAIGLSRAYRPVALTRVAVGLAVFATVLFPLVTALRTGLFTQRVEIERGGFTRETVGRSIESALEDETGFEGDEDDSLKLLGERLHALTSFALVIRYTPERHPYRLGEQFLMTPLVMVIPRVVWPDKPTPGEFTRVFKRMYWGLYDQGTSIAPSQLGGFWSNFGFVGVFLGMWLSGLLYGLLMRDLSFGTNGKSFYPLAVTSTLLPTLIQTFESEFEPLIEGLPKMLLIHFLVAWGLSKALRPQRRTTTSTEARSPSGSKPPSAATAANLP